MLADFDLAKTIKNGESGGAPDVNTELTSDMDQVWTVSGLVIQAYGHAVNASILREPHPLSQSMLYSTFQDPFNSYLAMILSQ
jgi:hypothetical protein